MEIIIINIVASCHQWFSTGLTHHKMEIHFWHWRVRRHIFFLASVYPSQRISVHLLHLLLSPVLGCGNKFPFPPPPPAAALIIIPAPNSFYISGSRDGDTLFFPVTLPKHASKQLLHFHLFQALKCLNKFSFPQWTHNPLFFLKCHLDFNRCLRWLIYEK